MLPHLGLDHLGVEVPHGDYGHQVGPIPALVELSQALHGCVFDDLRQPNWASLGIARVAKDQRKPIVLKTRSKTPAYAPLFQDDATLQLHFCGIQRNGEGPVAKDLKRRLENLRIVSWNLEEILGGVEAR